ncbi:MAG: type II toxin-antitoxin system Phd/YefM family antitoxin [Beijerinckiaceae bacterium]
MTVTQFKQVTAGDAARRFSEVNDTALKEPVVLTRNGRARTVLLSVETFERFLANERTVFLAKDTPPEFLDQLQALADGDFKRAGVPETGDQRAE